MLSFFTFILISIIVFSLVTLYLDDFKLSTSPIIKYLQIFTFICILLSPCIIYIYIYNYIDIVSCLNDEDKINLHGHIYIDKSSAKVLSQGLNTIGNNIGLGASIAGVGGAVAKGIAKSSIPPMQKAIIIGSGAALGGLIHTVANAINRNNALQDSSISNTNNNISNISSSINKFLDDSLFNISPLQELLISIQITSYICISLVFILIMQLFFKFFIKENININVFKIININFNNKFNYYINKILLLNKKMNNIYI